MCWHQSQCCPLRLLCLQPAWPAVCHAPNPAHPTHTPQTTCPSPLAHPTHPTRAHMPLQVRKLEFLLADAKASGADCVITIGGLQSNHARATAVAARYLDLPCHLILRTSRAAVEQDPLLAGNLLVERLAGATLHMVGASGAAWLLVACHYLGKHSEGLQATRRGAAVACGLAGCTVLTRRCPAPPCCTHSTIHHTMLYACMSSAGPAGGAHIRK